MAQNTGKAVSDALKRILGIKKGYILWLYLPESIHEGSRHENIIVYHQDIFTSLIWIVGSMSV
jgi:hypothetical protein